MRYKVKFTTRHQMPDMLEKVQVTTFINAVDLDQCLRKLHTEYPERLPHTIKIELVRS